MDILDSQEPMHEDLKPSLDDLVQDGYYFSFGRFWNSAMDVFKQCWGWVGLFIILVSFVGNILGLIPGFSFVWSFIQGAIMAGILLHCAAVYKRKKPDFNDFFKILKHLGPLIGYNLLIGLVVVVFFIPLGIQFWELGIFDGMSDASWMLDIQDDPSYGEDIVYAVLSNLPLIGIGLVVAMVLKVLFYMVQPLMIFGGLPLAKALKYSFNITKHHFFPLLGFNIVAALFSFVGVLACGVGWVFTAGFVFMAMLAFYEDLVGLQPKTH